MQYKLAQLILPATQKTDSLGEVFVAQPDTLKEELLGKLFVILQINSNSSNDVRLANFLISELNKNYYQNDKAILRERLKSITIEQVFESCLAKTNKNIADQLLSKKIIVDLRKINITIGVIFGTEVHFSNLGKNKINLFYRNKQEAGIDKYKSRDLTEDDNDTSEINPNKLFANLNNGILPQSGFMLFANEALPEYIGTKKLIEIITTLPPLGAIEHIKQQLEQLNSFVSFYAVLLKNTTGIVTADPPRRTKASANESINDLRLTESITEKLLMPTGLIDFRKWTDRGKKAMTKSKSGSNQLSLANKHLKQERRSTVTPNGHGLLAKTKSYSINIATSAVALTVGLLHMTKGFNLRPQHLTNSVRQLALFAGNTLLSPVAWFFNLRQRQRLMIFGSFIFLILFGLSLWFTSYRQKQLASSERIETVLTQIEEKENLIDSSLIYKNDEGALNLANEVRVLIASLPALKEANPKLDLLKTKFQDQEKKIRKIISVTPKEIANIGGLVAAAEPLNLTKTDQALYSSDSKNRAIYKIDLGTKIISTLSSGLENLESLNGGAIDNNLIYYQAKDKVFILNTKKDQGKTYEVKDLPLNDSLALAPYLDKLYVLNKAGEVMRLNFRNDSFTGPRNWLDQKVDTKNFAKLHIDGSIYMLYTDGNIVKFSRGEKQAFALTGLEPKLSKSTTMTSSDNFIYIADSNLKAITVFDNKGAYQKMYQADKFTDVTALQIDEKNKTGYVLADKAVYSFELK